MMKTSFSLSTCLALPLLVLSACHGYKDTGVATIRQNNADLKACIQEAAARNPNLKGKMELAFEIDPAGKVTWSEGTVRGPRQLPLLVQSLLTLAIVTPLGPLLYRLAYEKLADATVLVLLIVSVGAHFALTGLALVFFGAEGFRNPSFWDARFAAGPLMLSGQTLIIFMVSIALIVALFLFFERTLRGKALRATAVNRLGARLMGISTSGAGKMSFGLAAFMGALSGLLIGPTTTMFYDSGFLIGLKGFVAAIVGALASYPSAALGALFVGLIESFGSFYASALKEVIVFTLIIPVLLWRSFQHGHHDEEE